LHRNLAANARAITGFYGLGESDVSFCAMPLFHVHGLVASVLAALAGGGSVIVPSRFVPGRFLRYAREHGATWVSAGPTLHAMILDRLDGERVPTLRFARSCSSALSAELFERCEAAYGVPMVEAYGMTEGSHQIASNPLPPAERKVGSVGVPSPGVEIRIVDTGGADTEIGEVAIRGPGVTEGYVANPDANAQSFFGERWFRTGDRGRFDADGYLVLEGRLKELIIRGGENISPFEIEAALAAHPQVADSVAFAIPDPRYGEEVGAAVVLTGEAGEAELRSWCRERLAPFKVPRTIFILDEIPRTPTGKLQRARIGAKLTGNDS
jgi:acyl-CoA synthetase (AMP-forming)/AMP-acid ligase II